MMKVFQLLICTYRHAAARMVWCAERILTYLAGKGANQARQRSDDDSTEEGCRSGAERHFVHMLHEVTSNCISDAEEEPSEGNVIDRCSRLGVFSPSENVPFELL